jgi:hypothetical protein
MPEDARPHPWLGTMQVVQVAATVTLGVLGWQLSRDAEDAKQTIARIETAVKQDTESRLARESGERMRVQLFEQVSKAIATKDSRQLLAAKALVVSLIPVDDEFRVGLLATLEFEAGADVKPKLAQAVEQERRFLQDEASLAADVKKAETGATPDGKSSPSLGGIALIDVFHCTGHDAAGRLALANRAKAVLAAQGVRTRLRDWSDNLNASPGYRVTGLQVRYNDDERVAAESVADMLRKALSLPVQTRRVLMSTPNYLSFFAC